MACRSRPSAPATTATRRCAAMSEAHATGALLHELGVADPAPGLLCGATSGGGGALLESLDPSTGKVLGRVKQATRAECETAVARTAAAFEKWRLVPAPQRGEIVRQ